MDKIKPSFGMLWHALAGLALAGVAVGGIAMYELTVSPWLLYLLCSAITVTGFARELVQAGSVSNFNVHKFFEGLAWSACWLAVLI